jgi:hypothetical protein
MDASLSVRPLSSAAAINIPSPPLTPQRTFDDQVFQQKSEDCRESGIFSSRFQKDHRFRGDGLDLKALRPSSSSAPSAMSPLQMRASSAVPMTNAWFTFTSNTHAKETRDSYESFLSTMKDDYWKSVSTIRTTYFFDGIGRGGGFLAVSARCSTLISMLPCMHALIVQPIIIIFVHVTYVRDLDSSPGIPWQCQDQCHLQTSRGLANQKAGRAHHLRLHPRP